jgi:spermidine synthase
MGKHKGQFDVIITDSSDPFGMLNKWLIIY